MPCPRAGRNSARADRSGQRRESPALFGSPLLCGGVVHTDPVEAAEVPVRGPDRVHVVLAHQCDEVGITHELPRTTSSSKGSMLSVVLGMMRDDRPLRIRCPPSPQPSRFSETRTSASACWARERESTRRGVTISEVTREALDGSRRSCATSWARMILVDTGPLYAYVDRDDRYHGPSLELLATRPWSPWRSVSGSSRSRPSTAATSRLSARRTSTGSRC